MNNFPFSFTTQVDFLDDNGRNYSIPISGTTDNCLLTNYPFLQRNPGEYKLIASNDKPINLEIEDDLEGTISDRHNKTRLFFSFTDFLY